VKKKINFFLIALITFVNTYAQTAYYDALNIRNNCVDTINSSFRFKTDPASVKKLSAYLRNYLPDNKKGDPALTEDQVLAQFSHNAFFGAQIQTVRGGGMSPDSAGFISSTMSSIGGLNVASFADGLAKFLVKRFKGELTTVFFKRFKNDLEKSEELKTLFPQTYKVLMLVDSDVYQFNIYLNTIREAFIKDFAQLYPNLKKAEQLPVIRAYLDDPVHKEVKTFVNNAFFLIDQYANNTHPGDVIANYEPDNMIFSPDSFLQMNIRSSVKVLQLVSASVRSVSKDHYWVSPDSIIILMNDPVARDIYFGLLMQKNADCKFHTLSGDQKFSELLGAAKGDIARINQYRKYVTDLAASAQEAGDYISSLQLKKKTEIDYNDYYRFFSSSLDIIEKGLSFTRLSVIRVDSALQNNINHYSEKLINLARTAGDLYVDVRTKNYASAIINATIIIDSIVDNTANSGLRNNVLKYGTLAATVAQAQNADEVEKAIESIALPPGSYSVKQKSAFNISLNGYVGYAFDFNGGLFAKGIYAPVGFTGSMGLGRKHQWALSLFASVIDIGGLVSYRLSSGLTDTLKQEIRLESIISPSLQLMTGIPKTPIAFCAGWRMTPKLFYAGQQSFQAITARSVFNLSVLVDIPIINILNRPYKK